MERSKVNQFIERNKALLFPSKDYSESDITNALMAASEDFELVMDKIPFRNPGTSLGFAILLGGFGVDRFYLGDIGKGVVKLITLGLGGIWWIVDMFTAKKRCCSLNCKMLLIAIDNPSSVSNMMSAKNFAKAMAPHVKQLAKSIKDVGDSFGNPSD